MTTVKPRTRQSTRARETRRKVVAAAKELFVNNGYGVTTLQEIADRAGVSVQTIYFAFGNKSTVLKEVVDTSIAGDDEPLATMERQWFLDALALPTASEQLRAYVAGTRRILDRVAAVSEVSRTAALMDPELAKLWHFDTDPRHSVHTAAAKALRKKPGANTRLTATQAADRLHAILSPELYLLLVRDRGWKPQQFEAWALDILKHQLCREDPRNPTPPPS